MGTVPRTRIGRIRFYESHLGPWAAHAAEIGLPSGSVTALAALTAAARAAYDDHRAAADAARAATVRFHDAVAAMHAGPGAGADMLMAIRTFARSTDDPGVYELARIDPPRTSVGPGSTPPPGTPFDFTTGLLQNGAIVLSWKCENPVGGVVYEILRSVDGGPMGFVASVGSRTFIDGGVPPGSAAVTYQLTALRSTSRGDPGRCTVRFGTRAGAATTRNGAAMRAA